MAATLTGTKVIDVTQGLSGPLCTRNLAHMGAEVVKVERPGSGDIVRHWEKIVQGQSSGHVYCNVNKRSIAIDLKTSRGAELVREMAAGADVFVENFVPGTVRDFGLDYPSLRAINPRLIYCSISGFGQDGPFATRAAFDLIIQGESGLIMTNGTEEAPAKISLSICDIAAGMYATQGILNALLYRAKRGVGQFVDIAMFDCIMNWMGYFPFMYWYKHELPKRVGLQHHTMAPYGTYVSGDGRSIIVSGGSGARALWVRFCEAIGAPEIADDPCFQTNEMRIANREELDRLVTEALSLHTAEYWIERLHQAGIPCGMLNSLADALNHPQALHRKLYVEIGTARGPLKMVDYPVRMSEAEHQWQYGPPELGEHTAEILGALGYTTEQVKALRDEGVVQ